jgi:hypothetical protein
LFRNLIVEDRFWIPWIRNLCSGWHAYTLCIKLCTCFMFYLSTWAWLCSRGHIFNYYIPYTWSISPPVSEILKLPLIVYFSEAYIMWEARQDQWGIPEVAGWLAKQWWQGSSSWVCKGKLTSYDLFLARHWFLNIHRVSTEINVLPCWGYSNIFLSFYSKETFFKSGSIFFWYDKLQAENWIDLAWTSGYAKYLKESWVLLW